MQISNVDNAKLAEARAKAVENARLLQQLQNHEDERERLRRARLLMEIREHEEEAKAERIAEAIETGSPVGRAPKQQSVALPKSELLKIFDNRCDAFARYYFSPRPDENYDGIVLSENSKLHWWLYERLNFVVAKRDGTKTAVAAPRGNAKSMVTSVIFVLWCICFRKKRHIVIISDTDSQSMKFLLTIKNELENNSRLLEDFPEACGKSRDWRVGDIVTKNDIALETYGMGGAIRGTTYKSIRPDLVIMDDIENDEHVLTPEQRKKATDFLNKKILKLGNKDTDYFFIGTILHYDSLLSKTLRNPGWYSKKFKAVIQWSESSLWDEWERIFTDLSNANRESESRKFVAAHEEEMIGDTEVLWPEHEPYIDLMEMRVSEGRGAFNSEKQNEPIDPDEATFCEDDIQYFDEKETTAKIKVIVGSVDPSMGKTSKSNYSAIITLAKDQDGYLYVLDADIKRRTPDKIIDDILAYHVKRDYSLFTVESVAFQEFFKDQLLVESRKKGVYIPAKGIKTRQDKRLRIESLQPLIKSGTLKFKRTQTTLINQLLHFPLDDDDGPDALALCVASVRKTFRLLTW